MKSRIAVGNDAKGTEWYNGRIAVAIVSVIVGVLGGVYVPRIFGNSKKA